MYADGTPHLLLHRLEALNTRALSSPARYAHVALLLGASGMSVLVAALLLTEPHLPTHTQTAFGVMLAMGVAWVIYAAWVLRHRRPLYARHRVVAGSMAVAFTTLFTVAGVAAWAISGAAMARTAAVVGACMLVIAIVGLLRAQRENARLTSERTQLERDMAASGSTAGG